MPHNWLYSPSILRSNRTKQVSSMALPLLSKASLVFHLSVWPSIMKLVSLVSCFVASSIRAGIPVDNIRSFSRWPALPVAGGNSSVQPRSFPKM